MMKMNYIVLGTNDMPAAARFYDQLFAHMEIGRFVPSDRMTYWLGDDFAFAVALPFDQGAATNGNGTMVGFAVGSADDVRRMHSLAIELGGASEGEPGQRGPRYSAYVRDLDNNKLCFSD